MSLRIDSYVLRGELDNTSRNRIRGWIEVVRDSEHPEHRRTCALLSLTGNLSGAAAGARLKFEVLDLIDPQDIPGIDHSFQQQQVGILRDSQIRIAESPAEPSSETGTQSQTDRSDQQSALGSIYLDWSSQNGPVTLELLNTRITFLEPGNSSGLLELPGLHDSDLPAELKVFIHRARGLLQDQANEEPLDERDEQRSAEHADEGDLYRFLDATTEENIRRSAELPEEVNETESVEDELRIPPELRDLVQSITPDAEQMFQQLNEVLQGNQDEPLSWVLDEPLRLPVADQLESEEEAWQVLGTLLAALARKGVAFDMCPHFTAIEGYRLLTEVLLPEARIHPNLPGTGFVCHFTSASCCDECQSDSADSDFKE